MYLSFTLGAMYMTLFTVNAHYIGYNQTQMMLKTLASALGSLFNIHLQNNGTQMTLPFLFLFFFSKFNLQTQNIKILFLTQLCVYSHLKPAI